jgi:acyl-CoA dehydrogenase
MAVGATSEHVATTERDDLLRKQVQTFADEEVIPRIERMEETEKVEDDLAKLIARLGWTAVTYNEKYGGLGLGYRGKTVILETLSTASGAAGAIAQAGTIPAEAVVLFGNEDQRACWLPAIAEGECLPAIAVTEPKTGGDVLAMESTGTFTNGEYVLNGRKASIGNAAVADMFIVVVRTGPDPKDLTAFIVEADRPGIEVLPHQPLLGLRGFSCDQVILTNCRVPAGNMLGDVGQGPEVAHAASIRSGRPNLSAVALGLHQAAWNLTNRHVRSDIRLRKQQILRLRVAEIAAKLTASRVQLYDAVDRLDRGAPCDRELVSAKYVVTKAAEESANAALKNSGARGLAADSPYARILRDVVCLEPPAGTSDFQLHRIDSIVGSDRVQMSQLFAPPLEGVVSA